MILIEDQLLLVEAEKISQQAVLKPFSAVSVDFVESLSNKILLSRSSRPYPELMAMAHWLRRAHLLELQQEFESRRQDRVWLARGTALHFAPANVDTIFVYSWVLSLLVGNNNIVRLSSRGSEQVNLLLSFVDELLASPRFQIIKAKNRLVRYGRDDDITEALSACCDLRIIWGGDESVKHIRKIPLPTHAKEIVFSDKFSMALLNSQSLVDAKPEALQKLIHQFYNDSFWFDQLACSSPRVVVWLGCSESIQEARSIFWKALEGYCEKRKLPIDPARQIIRLTQLFELAAKNQLNSVDLFPLASKHFMQAELKMLDDSIRNIHQGGQLFLEYSIRSLDDLSPLLCKKDQTLSVYGVEKAKLKSWVEQLPQAAFDRVVPLGEALNFQTVWDGYALLQELTREVFVIS